MMVEQEFDMKELIVSVAYADKFNESACDGRLDQSSKEALASAFIARMRARGSSANTLRGALRYARNNMVDCIPGIRFLSSGPQLYTHARKVDFDTRYNWTHAARVRARAQLIYALTAPGETALSRLEASREACPQSTLDVRQAIETVASSAVVREVKDALSNNWPYRQSSSTWAGGEHRITVNIGDTPAAAGDSVRAWSANGTWSGTNSRAVLTATERCLPNLGIGLVVAGLLTLDAERVGPREYKAVWVEQGRGFALKTVKGWIIRGHHVTGGLLVAARKKAAAARNERLTALLSARVEKRLASGGYDLSTVMVSRADSIAAGNCGAGTDSFIERFRDQLEGRPAVSGKELVNLRNDSYTQAALAAALLRARLS